jgi:hypothetical protein
VGWMGVGATEQPTITSTTRLLEALSPAMRFCFNIHYGIAESYLLLVLLCIVP